LKRSILKIKDQSNQSHRRTRSASLRACVCTAAMLLAGATQAQTIYRLVGADGRVTFSDKLPVATDNATVLGAGGKSLAATTVALPVELRQVASKYPVTLYTSSNCAPCNTGRDLLGNRGIPYAERTISTADDSDALQRISGSSSLPFLTIGSQQIKGFSDTEWTQFLDAAGYPKTSVLPASYRAPPATPLVVTQKAAPAAPATEAQPQRDAVVAPVAPAANPAGIRF
jgi:glutaredoxin